MIIAIACDHAAFRMKEEIKAYLEEKGHRVKDCGTDSEERCDYPVYGERAALAVKNGEAERGILICGTGVGISLAANKVRGIRAAVCSDALTARLSREHNKAQIIAFGARIVGIDTAKSIVDAFLEAEFQGGRHARRVALLDEIEQHQLQQS